MLMLYQIEERKSNKSFVDVESLPDRGNEL
jgi:hypothetical protein